jgi:hypothetical protein
VGTVQLTSCLAHGDVFLSFWLDERLTVLAGDHRDVLLVEDTDGGDIRQLVAEFERFTNQPDYYGVFFVPEVRPSSWPAPVTSLAAFTALWARLAALLVSDNLRELIARDGYTRLLLFPDSILNALPLHFLLAPPGDVMWTNQFLRGVAYAPSASAYAYASQRKSTKSAVHALILVGDRDDEALVAETREVAAALTDTATIVSTRDDLQRHSGKADLLYVASHGSAPSGPTPHGEWTILFDGAELRAEDFYRGRIRLNRGATVVLSACSVGSVTAGAAHELEGLVHALFYAGAATVLAARWPVLYETATSVFCGAIRSSLYSSVPLSTALNGALASVARDPQVVRYMRSPDCAPFFFGPFVIFGCAD